MEILEADTSSLESDLPEVDTTTLHGAKDQIQPGVELLQHDALRIGAAMERGLHRALAPPGETGEEPTLLPQQLKGGGEKFDSSFQDDCGLDKIARNHRVYGIEVSDRGIAGGVTLHCEKDGHEEDDLSISAGANDVGNSTEEEELNVKSGCVKLCLTPRRQDDLEEDAIALHASRDNNCVTENSTKVDDAIECAAAEIQDSTSTDPQIDEADTGAGVSTESTVALNLVASKDTDSVAVQRVDEIDAGESVPTESSGALTLPCEKDGHEPDDLTGAGVSTNSTVALNLVASKDADSVAVQRVGDMDAGESVPTESSGALTLPCEKDGHEPDDLTGAGVSTDSTVALNLVASKDTDSVAVQRVDEIDAGESVPTESSGALALPCEKDGHEPDDLTGADVSTDSTVALNMVASKDADSVAVQRVDEIDAGESVPTESSGALTLPCEKDGHEPDDPSMISDLDDQDCTQQEVNAKSGYAKSGYAKPCQKRRQDDPKEQERALQPLEEGVIDSQSSF